jgi:hypothetical protein
LWLYVPTVITKPSDSRRYLPTWQTLLVIVLLWAGTFAAAWTQPRLTPVGAAAFGATATILAWAVDQYFAGNHRRQTIAGVMVVGLCAAGLVFVTQRLEPKGDERNQADGPVTTISPTPSVPVGRASPTATPTPTRPPAVPSGPGATPTTPKGRKQVVVQPAVPDNAAPKVPAGQPDAAADGAAVPVVAPDTVTVPEPVVVAPQPVRVNAYDNFAPVTSAGHAMCLGNPGRPESMPGGTVTQAFVVPAGVAAIDTVKMDVDPNSQATLTLTVSTSTGTWSATTVPTGDTTTFAVGRIVVSPGEGVTLTVRFSSTLGKLLTVYTVGSSSSVFTARNSCSDGAPNYDGSALRAVVYGWSQ